MKNYLIKLAGIASVAALSFSCIDMMEDVKDVDIVKPITVSYKVNAVTGFVPKSGNVTPDPNFPTKGLDVTFTNISTDQVFTAKTDENSIATADIEPGVYSIGISGRVTNGGNDYFLNGNIPSISLFTDITPEEAAANKEYQTSVRPAKVGSLLLSEIYYCGATNYYFRDQTYRIYNNGDAPVYLDGLCFAQLHPNIASAGSTLPVWPDEDGDNNYVYALWVWQFPGSGTDFPLQPGESVAIVQEARNHTTNNADSYDNSQAEWELWTGNTSRDNADVPNMPYIFYNYLNKMQFLSSVFGGAFVIYRPDDGTVVNEAYYDKSGSNVQNEVNKSSKYAKIPADWVLDGVELLGNMGLLSQKRIPGFVDAGASSVGETYCCKTVSRKVTSTRADGTPIYADTNNSTNDFQVNNRPELRRNGEKAPAFRESAAYQALK